jgi:hypothetical protein
MNNDKFDYSKLWPDLIKIVISFILITVVGGGLSYFWQLRSNEFQNNFDQQKTEKETASKVFEDLSKLMDKQICDLQLFLKDLSPISQYQLDYLQWRENNTRFRALLENYYGKSATNSYIFVSDKFNMIFEDLVISSGKEKMVDLQTSVNELEIDIYKFNSQLIDALLNGKVGSYKE